MTGGAAAAGARPSSTMQLEHRHAIITGGNRGLGAHIARAFVREGAHVLLCARDAGRLEAVANELRARAAPGQQVLPVVCDVAQPAALQAMVTRAAEAFPSLEILVNCAGACGPVGAAADVDPAAWQEAFNVNVFGMVHACNAVTPLMRRQHYGKIIALSGGGATKPLPHLSAYAASKAAAVRFVETLAVELKEAGIDVNAMAPGVLATDLVDEFVKAGPDNLGQAYLEEVARQKRDPLPAFERAAALAVFLASAASDGITGRLLSAVWDPWDRLPSLRAPLAQSDVYTLRRITPEDRGFTWGPPS